ncbi:MAG: hypothetical protein HY829_15170 [Actinobacteria bacterium]|nr:hypothetical protein [Actinomycetota bacterium]
MPALRRAARLLSALFLLCVLGVQPAFGDASSLTISDARIKAPVGLATDQDHHLYWTAPSTPDKQTSVFAIGSDGRVLAVLTYPQSTAGVLAVGYDTKTLYVLDRSTTGSTLRLSYLTLSSLVVSGSLPYQVYTFLLPESGQTAAALIVAPHSQFSVVSTSGRVYRAPAKPSLSGSNKLTKVATLSAGVTGGYYDPTRVAVVLRTAEGVLVTDPTSLATRSSLPVGAAADGRGITGSLDGQSYLLGQGTGTTVISVPLSAASPSASASSPASPSPSATPADAVAATPAAKPGPPADLFGNGTRWALAGALVLALLAGLVAAARR